MLSAADRSIRSRKGGAANSVEPHHGEHQPESLTVPAAATAGPPGVSKDCRVLVFAIGIVAALAGGSWTGLCVLPALVNNPAAGLAGVFPPILLLVSVALQIDHAAGDLALRAFALVFVLAALPSGLAAALL